MSLPPVNLLMLCWMPLQCHLWKGVQACPEAPHHALLLLLVIGCPVSSFTAALYFMPSNVDMCMGIFEALGGLPTSHAPASNLPAHLLVRKAQT